MEFRGICPVCGDHTIHSDTFLYSSVIPEEDTGQDYPALVCHKKHTVLEVRESLNMMCPPEISNDIVSGADTTKNW